MLASKTLPNLLNLIDSMSLLRFSLTWQIIDVADGFRSVLYPDSLSISTLYSSQTQQIAKSEDNLYEYHSFSRRFYVCLTRLTNIELSLLHVRHLSDVPVLALLRGRLSRRHAPFPFAFHTAVSSTAVKVRYADCVYRVGIKPTVYYYLSKRT